MASPADASLATGGLAPASTASLFAAAMNEDCVSGIPKLVVDRVIELAKIITDREDMYPAKLKRLSASMPSPCEIFDGIEEHVANLLINVFKENGFDVLIDTLILLSSKTWETRHGYDFCRAVMTAVLQYDAIVALDVVFALLVCVVKGTPSINILGLFNDNGLPFYITIKTGNYLTVGMVPDWNPSRAMLLLMPESPTKNLIVKYISEEEIRVFNTFKTDLYETNNNIEIRGVLEKMIKALEPVTTTFAAEKDFYEHCVNTVTTKHISFVDTCI
jgi:hypothetical protein